MAASKLQHHAVLRALLGAVLLGCSGAFQIHSRSSSFTKSMGRSHFHMRREAVPGTQMHKKGSTQLQCSLLPSAVSKISPPVRNALIVGTVAAAIYSNRRMLYPGTDPDPDFDEPLPNGSFGCPLVGNLSFFTDMAGDHRNGPGVKFYRKLSARAGDSRIFKFMALGKPFVVLTGKKSLRRVFNREFRMLKTRPLSEKAAKILGRQSLLFSTDPARHQFLRRLVGQSLTPEAVESAMPALIEIATRLIDDLSLKEPVVMEEVMTRFTLDVAWRQILGLDLREEEVETFYDAVNMWIGGVINPFSMILPGSTPAEKSYGYLVSKIKEKIDSLKRNGPDGSTLSGMVYAKDEEDPTKSLTEEEIIDNSLILILAGSETAASTLTVANLALGLHKDVLRKLKKEQVAMMANCGDGGMTRDALEKECPYLDAVIKETMRIKPLAYTGVPRFVEETFIVEGKQVPKGYAIGFNPTLTHLHDPSVKEDEDGAHMDIVRGFRPERWLDDATRPTEYIPFGVGPRYCLGANLALAEMKVFLALFARRVEFDLASTTAEKVLWKKATIIPKPKDGALIKVSSLSEAAGAALTSA